MPGQIGRSVDPQKVAACLTCSLCNNLYRDATTINKCLHTFCKECIYNKLKDEGVQHCPVCNTNLGSSPLDFLMKDHSYENLRNKLFVLKPKKVKPVATQSEPSAALLVQPMETSLSSVVPSPDEVVPKPSKRLRAIARMSPAQRESHLIALAERQAQKSIPDIPNQQQNNNGSMSRPGPTKSGLKFSEQQTVGSSSNQGRPKPIWFSLMAIADQGEDLILPQIRSRFLRVEDGSLLVLDIKKYLVQKLGLASSEEVEILVLGEPIDSRLQLDELLDCWIEASSITRRKPRRAGGSPQDFLMDLYYIRKPVPPSS